MFVKKILPVILLAFALTTAFAYVDDALSFAQEAALPYVKKGFSVREDAWGGDLGVKEQQAMQAQQQAQQQQEAMALAKRGEEAKIAKLEAEAAKAAAEAKKAEFELSNLNGDLHAMVQQAVVQALHSVSGTQPI